MICNVKRNDYVFWNCMLLPCQINLLFFITSVYIMDHLGDHLITVGIPISRIRLSHDHFIFFMVNPIHRKMVFKLKWLILSFRMTHITPNSHLAKHMYRSCSIWPDLFQQWGNKSVYSGRVLDIWSQQTQFRTLTQCINDFVIITQNQWNSFKF